MIQKKRSNNNNKQAKNNGKKKQLIKWGKPKVGYCIYHDFSKIFSIIGDVYGVIKYNKDEENFSLEISPANGNSRIPHVDFTCCIEGIKTLYSAQRKAESIIRKSIEAEYKRIDKLKKKYYNER